MMILRHIAAILALPTAVTVVVPYFILSEEGPLPFSRAGTNPLSPVRVLGGAILLAAGLALVCWTIVQFAKIGQGTLAPWDPPKRLVVTGVYRYARNPMISGVLLILIGEALFFASTGLLIWAACFFAVNAAYLPLVEEERLERRFGDRYTEYKRYVPRWIPRISPWEQPRRDHPGPK
jgi:protein-S-isoprenylcysteine O-methyltransferase Ste14